MIILTIFIFLMWVAGLYCTYKSVVYDSSKNIYHTRIELILIVLICSIPFMGIAVVLEFLEDKYKILDWFTEPVKFDKRKNK